MKMTRIAAVLLLIGAVAPASALAQSVVDDVRCVLLSNLVAKGIKDENAKTLAMESLHFYVGRLDGRASDQEITSAMRSIPPALNATAAKDIEACMERVRQAKQRMQALGSAVQEQLRK
jgi:hypothetical protein